MVKTVKIPDLDELTSPPGIDVDGIVVITQGGTTFRGEYRQSQDGNVINTSIDVNTLGAKIIFITAVHIAPFLKITIDPADYINGRCIIIQDVSGDIDVSQIGGAPIQLIEIHPSSGQINKNTNGLGHLQITAPFGRAELYCDGPDWYC